MAELDLDDDVILAVEMGSHYALYELYKIKEREGPIEINEIGVWIDEEGLKLTIEHKWYRRRNLKVKRHSLHHMLSVDSNSDY